MRRLLTSILAAAAALSAQPAQAGAVERGTRPWPGGVVKVWVDPAVRADRGKYDKLTRAMAAWRASTGLRIELAAQKRGPLLHVVNRTRTAACTANVGYWPRVPNQGPGASGGEMTIGACSYGSVLHEFGHVLGLMHEHQREDRLTYLSFRPIAEVLRSCALRPGGCGEARASVGEPMRLQLRSDYDPCSLMHYLADQSSKVRQGRLPPSPGWSQWYELTAAGEANYRQCKPRLARVDGCGWWKTGQKCQITCQDANTVAAFYGLRPKRACWGRGVTRTGR